MSGIHPFLAQRWQVLQPVDVGRIHGAAMHVLSEVGVVFKHEEALKVFRTKGAHVDGWTVRLSSNLVEGAIETTPPKVVLHARDPSRDVILGEGNIHYTSCFGPVRVRRPGEAGTAPATLDDLQRLTRLADALDNISYCLFQVRPYEIPSGWQDAYCAATMLKITDKHVHFSQDSAANTDLLIALGEIAAADAGKVDGPVFSMGGCPTTPLVYTHDVCARLLTAVPRGIPFLIVSGAMAGGTAPATLAGTLAVQNAEILAGITLAQLIRPGAPLVYGTFSGGMDMQTGGFVMGGAELALMQAATAQLCESYHIPFGYGSGGWTDAQAPTIQAGVEKACTLMSTALSGVEVIHSAHGGMLGGAEIADYAQMMIDDELCSMVNRYLSGVEVDTETLALDLIRHVGPGGHFLDTEHTARFIRKDHFIPRILVRAAGDTATEDILDRAQKRAEKILGTHKPRMLSQGACEEIDSRVELAVKSAGQ